MTGFMRAFVVLGCMMAALMAAVSICANIFYGLTITAGPAKYVYSVGGGMADCLKVMIPLVLAWRIREGQLDGQSGQSRMGWFFFWIATAWSVFCAIGLYEIVREERIGSTEAVKARHLQLTQAKDRLHPQLDDLKSAVPLETLQGQVEAAKRDFKWNRTKGCKDATLDDSRAYCGEIDKLVAAIAVATPVSQIKERKMVLSDRLNEVDRQLAGISLTTVLSATDPATRAFSKLSGLPQQHVRAFMALLIGIIIEFGGSLGGWILTSGRHREATVQTVQEPSKAETLPLPETDNLVATWSEAYLVRRRGCHIPAGDLYKMFLAWCRAHGEDPLNQTAFGREMGDLGFEKKKSGRIHYQDLALVSDKPDLRLVSGSDNAPRPIEPRLGRTAALASG